MHFGNKIARKEGMRSTKKKISGHSITVMGAGTEKNCTRQTYLAAMMKKVSNNDECIM